MKGPGGWQCDDPIRKEKKKEMRLCVMLEDEGDCDRESHLVLFSLLLLYSITISFLFLLGGMGWS